MFNLKLAAKGWSNLKKIAKEGVDGLVDVFTPSGGDVVKQVKNVGGAGPAPAIVELAPAVVDPIITTVTKTDVWKYAKYAAIGGAALIGLAILRR